MEYDEENIEIRKRLLNLPKFKASENFLNDLYYKINNLESKDLKTSRHTKEKAGFWNWVKGNIFTNRRNPWLAPALGFTAVLLIVFSVVIIMNRVDFQDKEKVTTESGVTTENKDTPPPAPNLSEQTPEKDESEGMKITEDLSREEQSTIISEDKYTDQGKYKVKTETMPDTEGEIKNEGMNKVSEKKVEKPEIMEQKSTDKVEVKDEEKGKSEIKGMKKADTGKKDEDVNTAKSDKEKTDVKKSEKEKTKEKEVIQGANEIDKNSLKTLKEKLEKGLKQ